MRRWMGVLPVLLLAAAMAVSTVIGLSLSHDATRSITDQLGCQHVRTSRPQAGVVKQTCSYAGDVIVILTMSKGEHTLSPDDLPDNVIVSTSRDVWVVGCQRRDDCIEIHQKLGGRLTSGPMLGLSLLVG